MLDVPDEGLSPGGRGDGDRRVERSTLVPSSSRGSARLSRVAGYSGTPLAAKLGIRPGSTVMITGSPPGFSLELPPDVVVRRRAGAADVIVAFHTREKGLDGSLTRLGQLIFPNGGLWIAWPKKSSGLATDVTDHVVRDRALPLGLVDNKVCAIDETWTGLRLVWRTERRTSRERS